MDGIQSCPLYPSFVPSVPFVPSSRPFCPVEALAGADAEARRAYESGPGWFRSAVLRGLVREQLVRRLAGGAGAGPGNS